jgi:hypothetical protein
MEKYKNLQWVIQRNLTNNNYLEGIKNACQQLGTGFIELDIIPFTAALPEFDKSRRSIVYGSTTFNELAFKDETLREGVFFDENNFSIENYIEKWGRYMLNYGAIITSFKELVKLEYAPDKLLFIRPDDDSKSFAGEVKQFDEINDWYSQLNGVENTNLSPESKIVVSEPYNIQFEWRLWIVNKKVIAASKYREYFKLKKEEGCPEDVILFAEERCKEYTPHAIFVMDICLCGDQYYIVECNSMNGAGFYNANIENIISSVSAYFIKQPNYD